MSERDNDLDRLFNESLSKLNKLSSETVADLSEVSFAAKPDSTASQTVLNDTEAQESAAESVAEKKEIFPEIQAENTASEQTEEETAEFIQTAGSAEEEISQINTSSENADEYIAEESDSDEYEQFDDEMSDDTADSDEAFDEEEYEEEYDEELDEEYEGEYEDEDFEDDEEFVEEYREVPAQKLQFNMHNDEKPKKRRRKKKKVKPNNSILVGTVVTVIVIAISFILSFLSIELGVEYMGFSKSEESITFDIPEGTTTATIGDLLYQKGIINNPTLFKFVMKMQKVSDANIYPGEITLSPNMTYPSIIQAFSKSRKVYETVTVTFTEGISLYKAAKLLEEKEVCTAADFLTAFNKNSGFDFEKDLTLSEQSFYKMEGFFFPDTYEFYKDDSPENVVSKIKTNFDNKMSDEVMTLVEQSGLSLYEVITLASIVQAEADTKENMELVASVFLNRLAFTEQFPHLESDATYFYVRNTISSAVGGMDKVSDYEYLYDTYSCFGLPIGAIGNPGMDAIMAVLKPATSNYCFFVTDSKTGEFYYAETLDEHNANCKKAGY